MADLKSELQAIYDSNNRLTPTDVLEAAADPEHALHHRFEWDDDVAGHQYRLVQAQRLIRSVKIRYVDRAGAPQAVRAFVSIQTTASGSDEEPEEDDEAPAGTYRYLPIEVVTASESMSRQLRQRMRRDWAAYKKRYRGLEEFWAFVREELEDHERDAA